MYRIVIELSQSTRWSWSPWKAKVMIWKEIFQVRAVSRELPRSDKETVCSCKTPLLWTVPFWSSSGSISSYVIFNSKLPYVTLHYRFISSVIKQKIESQNGCFKKTKHAKFSEKRKFLTPLSRTRTCVYQGVRNVCFSENLACFVFLKHPFWGMPFCLINDDIAFRESFFLASM